MSVIDRLAIIDQLAIVDARIGTVVRLYYQNIGIVGRIGCPRFQSHVNSCSLVNTIDKGKLKLTRVTNRH